MATILRDGGATTLAYADSRPYVTVAIIAPHHGACSIVPDACVKVLEADVVLDEGGGACHGSDASAHIAVTNIADDAGRYLPVLGTGDANPGVPDVVNDIVRDDAVMSRLDARRARLPNVIVALHVALGGVVLFPLGVVVLANAGDGEPVQGCPFRHGYSGAFAIGMIEYGDLGPLEAEFALGVVTGTAHSNAFPEPNAFLVGP